MTKGFLTTEFWLSAAAAIVGVIISSGLIPSDNIWFKLLGIVATILASLGYTWSRTVVKANDSKAKAFGQQINPT